MIRHEIPTHLDVEDKLIGHLTSKDALTVLVGASAAYGIGTSSAFEPSIRLGGAALVALVSVAFALVKVEGRPLEEWLLAMLAYAARPRRSVWKHHPGELGNLPSAAEPRWYPYHPWPRWQRSGRSAEAARRTG